MLLLEEQFDHVYAKCQTDHPKVTERVQISPIEYNYNNIENLYIISVYNFVECLFKKTNRYYFDP